MNNWKNEKIKELKNMIENNNEIDCLDLEIEQFNDDEFDIDELRDALIGQIICNELIYHDDAYDWLQEHGIDEVDEAIEDGCHSITSIANYYMHELHIEILDDIINELEQQ